jgi:hypothetical protein
MRRRNAWTFALASARWMTSRIGMSAITFSKKENGPEGPSVMSAARRVAARGCAQFLKLGRREIAMQFQRCYSVRRMCIFRRFKIPQMSPPSVKLDASSPRFVKATPVDALKPRPVVLVIAPIQHVLTCRAESEIRAPIVEAITITMIDLLVGWRIHQEAWKTDKNPGAKPCVNFVLRVSPPRHSRNAGHILLVD